MVSHDQAFAKKVTDHLFVFEGKGVIKEFQGRLSEYGLCLVGLENDKIQSKLAGAGGGGSNNEKKTDNKEDNVKRNEARNFVQQAKKEMTNLERATEKLKAKAVQWNTK